MMTSAGRRAGRVPQSVVAEAEIARRHAEAVDKGAITLRLAAGSARVGIARPARDGRPASVEIVTWRVDRNLPSRVETEVVAIPAGEFAAVRELMEQAEKAADAEAGAVVEAEPVSETKALVARAVAANRAAARLVAACGPAADGDRCEQARAQTLAVARAAGVSDEELREAIAVVARWRGERTPPRSPLAGSPS